MGREASFELNCSAFPGSLLDFIKLLGSLGWSIYDDAHHAEYLPVGDRDAFDWQMDEITESGLYSILERKLQRGETVGLVLYYRDTGHGVTLLAADTSEILIIPNINRKTLVDDDEDSMTDVSWYSERLLQKLLWYNCGMTGFRYEEIEDGEDSEVPDDVEDFEEDDQDEDSEEKEMND